MKRSALLLIALVLASALLSACAVTARNALLGKWSQSQVDTTTGATVDTVFDFTMDGRMRIIAPNQITEIRYQFVNDHTIALKGVGSSGEDISTPFTISGNKLTLDVSGQVMEFERVR